MSPKSTLRLSVSVLVGCTAFASSVCVFAGMLLGSTEVWAQDNNPVSVPDGYKIEEYCQYYNLGVLPPTEANPGGAYARYGAIALKKFQMARYWCAVKQIGFLST